MKKAEPVRIQLKRTRGWRLVSPNRLSIVKVCRPGPWGNPFAAMPEDQCRAKGLVHVEDTATAVAELRKRITETAEGQALLKRATRELRGKNMACWCPLHDSFGSPFPCHADVWLELVN